MSDVFSKRISEKRKELTDLLKSQASRVKDIEDLVALAKKHGVPTADLDDLLKITKNIFRDAGVDLKKGESKP